MRFFKRILWKLSKRDFLILNPNWHWLGSSENLRIIGLTVSGQSEGLLPVQYSYHLLPSGQLDYFIFGSGSGVLDYRLSFSSGNRIADYSSIARLPCQLSVIVGRDHVTVNGKSISDRGADLVNPTANDLIAAISFTAAGQPTRTRLTHHRVKHPSAEVDEDYFAGRHYTDYQRQETQADYGHVLKLLASFGELKGRFIDIGCATGGLVREALQEGLDAYGVDHSEWAVKTAARHLGTRVKRADMNQASVDELGQGYHFVTAIAVLEHLKDPKASLRTLYDICAPGGILYILTLNSRSLLAKMLDADWAGRTDYSHFSAWIDWVWLRDASLEVGFDIESLATRSFWSARDLDPVWSLAARLFTSEPLTPMLADGYGDIVEAVLRRPDSKRSVDNREG